MTRAKGAVEWYVDFSGLEKFIGASMALSDVDVDKDYLKQLATTAFAGAETAFNAEAAAYATAGGAIKHMFEWGTIGVNRSRSNMRPRPDSAKARLWGTKLWGNGLNMTYEYFFKPSVAFVPKPTQSDTGMDAETISKLRDHIFWNKAQVFELGEIVSVKPNHSTNGDQGPFLLMPMYNHKAPPGARPHDISRGYTLGYGTNVFRPGQAVKGNFTVFWRNFWDDRGEAMVNSSVTKQLEEDFLTSIETNYSGMVKPASTVNIDAGVKAEQARVIKSAHLKARYRAQKAKLRNAD